MLTGRIQIRIKLARMRNTAQKSHGLHKSTGKGPPKKLVEIYPHRGGTKPITTITSFKMPCRRSKTESWVRGLLQKLLVSPAQLSKIESARRWPGKWQSTLQSSARTKISWLRKGCWCRESGNFFWQYWTCATSLGAIRIQKAEPWGLLITC